MNYLAHIYLSYNQPEIEIGNFIADAVKGKKYLNYSKEIQKGILLHRAIDTYTDLHPLVKECKYIFSSYGLYRSVIVDLIFDHFLAKNWVEYHEMPLEKFTINFYKKLEANFDNLPERVQLFYPYMKTNNWLYKYRSVAGISDIMFQMNRRTQNLSKMNYAVIELVENYTYLEGKFKLFFQDLEAYVKEKSQSFD